MKTKEQILQRICQIECELSDLHFANQTGTFDIGGNKRRELSEEWVILSNQYEKMV